MSDELLEKIAIEIEKSCGVNCPCGHDCHVSTDEQCMHRILIWLKSDECTDTIVYWVKQGLGLQND